MLFYKYEIIKVELSDENFPAIPGLSKLINGSHFEHGFLYEMEREQDENHDMNFSFTKPRTVIEKEDIITVSFKNI